MTGPDHYREAERLLAEATHWDRVPGTDPGYLLASAQVHATLALAAATAVSMLGRDMPIRDGEAWHAAAAIAHDTPPGGAA